MQIVKKNEKARSWVTPVHTPEQCEKIDKIAKILDINRITATLLFDRLGDVGTDEIGDFINGLSDYHDPYLLVDMEKAVDRIVKAIEQNEKITVYGDYDVDGITSVSVLVTYLGNLGANTDYYIPSRLGEGYGFNTDALDKIAESGTKLVVSVDTGITAKEEIEYAESIGLSVIVTDHHECKRDSESKMILPGVPAVNPRRDDSKYPFDELAGVGVAFKLICAIEMRVNNLDAKTASEKLSSEYGELVAIGTVADVMPLIGENRRIVKEGLERLADPKFVGIRELLNVCAGAGYDKKPAKKPTASLISFTLAPRINAAGRMGDASFAVELFTNKDSESAYSQAIKLCELNTLRQNKENEILNEAIEKMSQIDIDDRVIVLSDDNWHHGVIGIVASRMVEKYSKPCILVSFEGSGEEKKDTDIGKGSGRSIKGLDLVRALEATSENLVKFGGHELAAGLSVERGKLADFRRQINEYAKEVMACETLERCAEADLEIGIGDVNVTLAQELYILEPYGQANPTPRFVIGDLTIEEIYPLKDGKHTKLVLSNGKDSITALYFGMRTLDFEYGSGDRIDVLCSIEINEFMGKREAQLHIKGVMPSEEYNKKIADSAFKYNLALHGGAFPKENLPSRDDFVAIYKFLRANTKKDGIYSFGNICKSAVPGAVLDYITVRAVLDIMCELSLISYMPIDDKTLKLEVNKGAGKVDLGSSQLFKVLKKRAE